MIISKLFPIIGLFFLDIRLVNADNITSMGRVEVVTNGVWSTVCDEDWDHDDATVVCKQLGLGMCVPLLYCINVYY